MSLCLSVDYNAFFVYPAYAVATTNLQRIPDAEPKTVVSAKRLER
jgi:hypothetical protein